MLNKPLHRCVVLLLLFFCLGHPAIASDDLEWEQHGFIRYSLGFNWLDAGEEGIKSDFYYDDYSINLSGNLYKSENDIEYSIVKDPGIAPDIQLYWDNPLLSANYDQGIKVEFDELRLAFNKNQIDGLKVTSANDGITVFSGKESYIPLTWSRIVFDPGKNEYSLFADPSAGDIVEHSEVVILDGEVLTGGRDYSLNFLSGKLQMYVPMEWGSTIDVKFLFVVTNEELLPDVKGELLQGVMLSHRWQDNNFGVFYFNRGCAINQVFGTTGQYLYGPLRVRAELAMSKALAEEPAPAYELEAQYNDGTLDMSYQLRNVDPEFQEIGVVPFIKGKADMFGVKFQATPELFLQLHLNKYEFDDGWTAYTTSQKKASVDYAVNTTQSAQFIFEQKDRDLYGEQLVNNDFSVGYTVKTNSLSLALGQSIQDANKRYATIWADYGPFRGGGSYHVENLWDGKEHRAEGEISFRPFSTLDLMTFAEYRKRFDVEKPNLRLHLNGNWSPTDAWSINGGYMYLANPKYDASSKRFNSIINYSTSRVNSNLNFMKMRNESKTAKVDDMDITFSASMLFLKDYLLNYQLTTNDMLEYNKFSDMVNSDQKDRNHLLGLSYVWRDFYVFSTNLGYVKNVYGGQGFSSEASSYSLLLGCSYQKDLKHQFALDFGVERKADLDTGTIDSRLVHPIGPFKLDYTGKVSYQLNDKKLTRSLFSYSLEFPGIRKIIPSINFQSDFVHEGQCQRMRKIGGKLEYQWKERQATYLEIKGEQLVNWANHKDDYRSIGVYTGFQIDY